VKCLRCRGAVPRASARISASPGQVQAGSCAATQLSSVAHCADQPFHAYTSCVCSMGFQLRSSSAVLSSTVRLCWTCVQTSALAQCSKPPLGDTAAETMRVKAYNVSNPPCVQFAGARPRRSSTARAVGTRASSSAKTALITGASHHDVVVHVCAFVRVERDFVLVFGDLCVVRL
jgi:hypothetical protein